MQADAVQQRIIQFGDASTDKSSVQFASFKAPCQSQREQGRASKGEFAVKQQDSLNGLSHDHSQNEMDTEDQDRRSALGLDSTSLIRIACLTPCGLRRANSKSPAAAEPCVVAAVGVDGLFLSSPR